MKLRGILAIMAAWMLVAASGQTVVKAQGVGGPLTRAERTNAQETSTYKDVIDFLDTVRAGTDAVDVQTMGKSMAGRAIPLAVVARPMVASAAEARDAGKVVVYVQANIHGGEVEGKETALGLVRELARKDRPNPWLDRMVVLIAPIYNVDGNERWGDAARLRPSQDGPASIGERVGGEGLDLNRDAMKAQTREMRGALEHVYNAWDPDVVLDLHTTNGTRHGYALTYSPPLNPDTDSGLLAYTRDQLLPAVRARIARENGLKLFDYGNVQGQGEARGWYTFGNEGRYVTNYVGLRNRVAVLSEVASFLPFRDRIEVTRLFVNAVLDEVYREAGKVRDLTRAADARTKAREPGTPIGIRFAFETRGNEPIPLEVLAPGEVVDHRKAPKRLEAQVLPVFDRYKVARSASLPAAYLIPPDQTEVVALMKRHGIAVDTIKEAWHGPAEVFRVSEVVTTNDTFQSGQTNTRLEGTFEAVERDAPAGTFLVRTAQPLGTLAALLLEPESLDGVAAWGMLEGTLAANALFPILKTNGPLP